MDQQSTLKTVTACLGWMLWATELRAEIKAKGFSTDHVLMVKHNVLPGLPQPAGQAMICFLPKNAARSFEKAVDYTVVVDTDIDKYWDDWEIKSGDGIKAAVFVRRLD